LRNFAALFEPGDHVDQGGDIGWPDVLRGFRDFGNAALVAQILLAFLLAVLLGACIAYHPRVYGKARSLDDVEQPKILLMYAMVGSLVAEIVSVWKEMALVIFAIGGLMRFRTDAGAAKDTGRTILVTCVGLCCGLRLYHVAVLATAFGWMLIHYLEGRVAHRVIIKGVEPDVVAQSAAAHRRVLVENGASILSEKKNVVKKQIAFVFRAPGVLDREEMEELFRSLDPKLQGAVDWSSS